MLKKYSLIFALCCLMGCSPQSSTKEVSGLLRFGHEVRSFTDFQDNKEYWILDYSGQLMSEYQKIIGTDILAYQPIKAVLVVQDVGKMTDGFGADYDGAYEVKEIISLAKP